MKLGITLHTAAIPVEEKITYMKQYGFSAAFYSSVAADLEHVMQVCKREGIEMENYHAPFGHINDIWLDTEGGEQMLRELLVSVDNCEKYEVPTLVVHLSSGNRPPRINELGFSRFDTLMNRARQKGVTVAYENQRKLANLAMVFEEFDDAVFCWDTGHEACFAAGREYMPLFGHRIGALHVHDNHCIPEGDEHLLPYDGTIDFDKVARHLAKADYKGSLMLEVMKGKHPLYREISVDEYYARAAVAARQLADAVEKAKKASV